MDTRRSQMLAIATVVITVFAVQVSSTVNINSSWLLPQNDFPVFYRYFRDRVTWFEADAVCQFHHAQLATVESNSQFEAVRSYLKEFDVAENVWIGLKRNGADSEFTWTNYQPLARSGYFREEVSRSSYPVCVVTDPTANFKWHGLHCGGPEIASFVCELPVPYWASKSNGCMTSMMEDVTVTFLPERPAIQLTKECSPEVFKNVTCKGNMKQSEIMEKLSCFNSNTRTKTLYKPVNPIPEEINIKTTTSSSESDVEDYAIEMATIAQYNDETFQSINKVIGRLPQEMSIAQEPIKTGFDTNGIDSAFIGDIPETRTPVRTPISATSVTSVTSDPSSSSTTTSTSSTTASAADTTTTAAATATTAATITTGAVASTASTTSTTPGAGTTTTVVSAAEKIPSNVSATTIVVTPSPSTVAVQATSTGKPTPVFHATSTTVKTLQGSSTINGHRHPSTAGTTLKTPINPTPTIAVTPTTGRHHIYQQRHSSPPTTAESPTAPKMTTTEKIRAIAKILTTETVYSQRPTTAPMNLSAFAAAVATTVGSHRSAVKNATDAATTGPTKSSGDTVTARIPTTGKYAADVTDRPIRVYKKIDLPQLPLDVDDDDYSPHRPVAFNDATPATPATADAADAEDTAAAGTATPVSAEKPSVTVQPTPPPAYAKAATTAKPVTATQAVTSVTPRPMKWSTSGNRATAQIATAPSNAQQPAAKTSSLPPTTARAVPVTAAPVTAATARAAPVTAATARAAPVTAATVTAATVTTAAATAAAASVADNVTVATATDTTTTEGTTSISNRTDTTTVTQAPTTSAAAVAHRKINYETYTDHPNRNRHIVRPKQQHHHSYPYILYRLLG